MAPPWPICHFRPVARHSWSLELSVPSKQTPPVRVTPVAMAHLAIRQERRRPRRLRPAHAHGSAGGRCATGGINRKTRVVGPRLATLRENAGPGGATGEGRLTYDPSPSESRRQKGRKATVCTEIFRPKRFAPASRNVPCRIVKPKCSERLFILGTKHFHRAPKENIRARFHLRKSTLVPAAPQQLRSLFLSHAAVPLRRPSDELVCGRRAPSLSRTATTWIQGVRSRPLQKPS